MPNAGHTLDKDGSEPSDSTSATASPSRRLSRVDWAVFIAVLVFYAVTRLWGITDYPIYFFCDEAHQANLAQDFVANDFHDEDGNFCPAYFRNVRVFNLGLSVWIQALPVTVFGKTIFTVRATSAMVGLVGAAALMLALKWFFAIRLWWAGGLVMAAFPAWFLHSRTAFETAMMVGFYATFVLTYLLYRMVSPGWAPAAVICGAATFYSYSNGQGVMFVTGLLLLAFDWRYHWRVVTRHRGAAAAAAITVVLVAAPFVHFRFVLHPEMMGNHLDDLNSYWIQEIPAAKKITIFATTYLRGLSPIYWFTEDTSELVRHRMLGYPHLTLWMAPLVLIGVVLSIARFRRSPPHRLIVIAIVAAPFSASLVDIRITRVLAMIVPATLAATVGLDWVRVRLERKVPDRFTAAIVAVGLAAATAAMTYDALANGPRWFPEYGMQGQQWGARELFASVRRQLHATPPAERIFISHLWANNANSFGDFFLDPDERRRIEWGSVEDLLRSRSPLVRPGVRFALTAAEAEQVRESPKLDIRHVFEVIDNPRGEPGFVIAGLAYTSRADSIFLHEMRERRRPVEGVVQIDGAAVEVKYPKLDMGKISDAFDGNPKSIARTLDANPAVLELQFPEARSVAGLRFHLWTEVYRVRLQATRANGEEIGVTESADTRENDGPFDILLPVSVDDVVRMRLTISKNGDEHVHMREIEILE